MKPSVYGYLNESAKAWWHHRRLRKWGKIAEARREERRSIRDNARMLRETIKNQGYLSFGRGGWCLHIGHWRTLRGYVPEQSGTCQAAKHLRIPIIDSRTIPEDRVLEMIRLPMVGLEGHVDDEPYGSISYAPLEHVALAYENLGATLYNFQFVEEGEI